MLGVEKQAEGQLQRGCSNLASSQVFPTTAHTLFKAPSIHLGVRVVPEASAGSPSIIVLRLGRGELLTLPYKGLVVRDETGRRVEQVFGQARKREKGITGAIGEVF